MNILETLQAKSNNVENAEQQIKDEILSMCKTYLNSEAFEKYLEKRCSDKDVLLKRQGKVYTEFWAYHAGCSDTYFSFAGKRWVNPENPNGYKSTMYKGIDLYPIHEQIVKDLRREIISKLEDMGFENVISHNCTKPIGYLEYEITFSW